MGYTIEETRETRQLVKIGHRSLHLEVEMRQPFTLIYTGGIESIVKRLSSGTKYYSIVKRGMGGSELAAKGNAGLSENSTATGEFACECNCSSGRYMTSLLRVTKKRDKYLLNLCRLGEIQYRKSECSVCLAAL